MARAETGNSRKTKERRDPVRPRKEVRAPKPARKQAKPKRSVAQLEADLLEARTRIDMLEAQRAEFLKRIDVLIDSLQSLVADAR